MRRLSKEIVDYCYRNLASSAMWVFICCDQVLFLVEGFLYTRSHLLHECHLKYRARSLREVPSALITEGDYVPRDSAVIEPSCNHRPQQTNA